MFNDFDSRDVNAKLYSLIECKDYDGVSQELLTNHSLRINKKNQFGWRVLNLAINDHEFPLDVVSKILDYPGFQINKKDDIGRSYLHDAISTRRIDLIRVLLEKGIDLSLKDDDGYDAISFAKIADCNEDILSLLESHSFGKSI